MKTKSKREGLLWFLGITLYSLLIFTALLAGNKDVFYSTDDNIMQWGPVIRRAFDQIFNGQNIPYWNFYQYKGLDIFSSGYYGLLNPFMYISYILSRFVFSYELETLVIYEWLMYWLGLLIMCRVMKELSLRLATIIISLITYSTSILFFSYAFYYFTFNNFFFMPLFLWIMMRTRNHKSRWFVPGIIMAFSLLMGHVQYSCYYIIAYCIIQVVFAVQDKDWKTILPIFTTIGLFAGLSSVFMLQSLSVSEYRDRILLNEPSAFLLDSINVKQVFNPISTLMFHSEVIDRTVLNHNVGLGLFPLFSLMTLFPFYNRLCEWLEKKLKQPDLRLYENKSESYQKKFQHFLIAVIYFISAKLFLSAIVYDIIADIVMTIIIILAIAVCAFVSMRSEKNFFISQKSILWCMRLFPISLCLYAPFYLYIAMVVLYIISCTKKMDVQQLSVKERCLHAFMFAGFFFVLFGAGWQGVVALIMNKIPVINKFRFLYKCSFIYIPILIICGAAVLDKASVKFQKHLYRASAVFSVIAFANIVYITYSGMHPYINNKIFDYQHYRKTEQEITAQMEKVGVDSNYRFLTLGKSTLAPETSIEISSQICTYGLTKNYCTVYGVFSLAGYDNIFTTKGFEQSDMLLSSINIEGMMCNMVANPTMYRGYMESKDKIKMFETQMIENGVKYVLLPKNDAEVTDIFNELIDTCEQLKIIRTVPWSHNYVLTELGGVKPICSYDNTEKLPLETSLDVLRFQTDFTETKTVTISMTYDPHYIMRLTDSKGTVSELQLKESASGYVTAEIPAGTYSVKFYYENFVMDLAVILAIVTLLLTAVAIFVTAKQPIEAKSDTTNN